METVSQWDAIPVEKQNEMFPETMLLFLRNCIQMRMEADWNQFVIQVEHCNQDPNFPNLTHHESFVHEGVPTVILGKDRLNHVKNNGFSHHEAKG